MPQAADVVGLDDGAPAEAKTESFFWSFFEPQCGQAASSDFAERTSNSNSFSHLSQLNSKSGMAGFYRFIRECPAALALVCSPGLPARRLGRS